MYNFGFLFRTVSDEVIRVYSNYKLAFSGKDPLKIPSGMPLVVKHTNILLDGDYEMGITNILSILRYESLAPVNSLHIVHPYISILGLFNNPIILMKDMGEPLSYLMEKQHFRQRWSHSAVLRRAFLIQIGFSALNLVDKLLLCHNDIRPPNIAVSGESFSLIDFDLSRLNVREGAVSAFVPLLPGMPDFPGKSMCFSVAQIILSVFMLSSPTAFSLSDVTRAVSVWQVSRDKSSDVDCEFEAWVQGRGGVLLEFVEDVRGSAAWPPELWADSKGFCTAVLECLLE